MSTFLISRRAVVAGASAVLSPAYLRAQSNEEIEVSSYGIATVGFPYAVALDKGFFREFGANIAGIRSSAGGAATIRNMIAGNLAYADAGVTGIVTANRSGASIRIIGNSTDTFADVIWVTMPNSPVRSISDLRGRKIGFTTARSATNMLAVMLLETARLSQSDVQLIAAGGFPQALTALETGGIDVAPIVEPNFSINGSRYRVLAPTSELFPPMSNTCCITTQAKAGQSGGFLRGVLAARRKAVDFLYDDPPGAAASVAAAYRIERQAAETVIRNMIGATVGEITYWSRGRIRIPNIDQMLNGARLVGIVDGSYDVRQIVNNTFLPEDQRELG